MTFFETALSGLGGPIVFDEDNLFACELNTGDGHEKSSFLLSAYRNFNRMSLHISILTNNGIPETIPSELLIDFGQHTLSLNSPQYGIGIFPSTDRIAVYKEVILPDLLNHPQDHVMNVICMMISAVKIWDEKLASLQHRKEGYDQRPQFTDGLHHNRTNPPPYKKGTTPQLKTAFSSAFIKKIFSPLLQFFSFFLLKS